MLETCSDGSLCFPEMVPSPLLGYGHVHIYLCPLVFGTHPDIITEEESIGEVNEIENGMEKQDTGRSSMTSLSHCINLTLKTILPLDSVPQRLTIPLSFKSIYLGGLLSTQMQ